jgi:hypothetical protein
MRVHLFSSGPQFKLGQLPGKITVFGGVNIIMVHSAPALYTAFHNNVPNYGIAA